MLFGHMGDVELLELFKNRWKICKNNYTNNLFQLCKPNIYGNCVQYRTAFMSTSQQYIQPPERHVRIER